MTASDTKLKVALAEIGQKQSLKMSLRYSWLIRFQRQRPILDSPYYYGRELHGCLQLVRLCNG